MSDSPRVDVALVTEGTYPYHLGGVTVWCDQLVRGFPDQLFQVIAITGAGNGHPALGLPDNVASVRPVPLWGPTPRRTRPRSSANAVAIAEAHDHLLSAIADPGADPEGDLLDALGRLHQLSTVADVGSVLRSEPAVRRVHGWLRSTGIGTREDSGGPPPTVGDALTAADLLERFLRPLWARPPRARITHCVSNGLAALIGMSAKWSFGTPMVLAEHGVYLRERYLASDSRAYPFPVRAFVLRFFRLLTGASYRVADLITPVCEYNQRWQVRTGAESDIIRAVYNGVDATRFRATDTEPDVPTLAWVGRVDPLKDVETLVRAFHKVRARIPDAKLRMFGPIPAGNERYHARCEALIHELGLDGAATFEGRAAEITDAYHAGHVVVLTSVSEAFPYTVIEAMASGRATVSTDVGGVREAVGDAGLVAPPRDADAIAAACVRLLGDPALRRSLASRARERVLDQFTLARFLDVYRGIYSDFAVKDDPAPRAERTPELHVELVGAVL